MIVADQRALDAAHRIERALARIEAAAARAAAGESGDHRRLQERHDKMRSRVSGALAQLDQLIAAGERR